VTSSRRRRVAIVAVWILPALVATLGLRLVPSRLNPDLGLLAILAAQLLIWLPWGLWSTLIAALGERFPFERGALLRSLAAHALLGVFVVFAQIAVIWSVTLTFGMNERRGLDSMVVIGIRQYGDLLLVIYGAVVGTFAGLRWQRQWQAAALQAAQLREDVARASLQALRAQLNPHFLFNALNAVVTLIGRDPSLARDMLVRLADLLRATLTAGEAQESTLNQELDLTRRYLEIEQLRFVDRLRVEWKVDPGLGDWLVPAFALQPLVENALRHGLARRRAPGVVEIVARRDGDVLELRVGNDGPDDDGAPPATRDGAGIALDNLRSRCARLYGDAATLELRPRADRGMDAILRLPRHAGGGVSGVAAAGTAPRHR
jgi:hypothetical protein